MATTDLTHLSAATLADLLADRSVSAREVAVAHLDRIAEVDGEVHAFLHVDAQQALAAADAVDARRAAGTEVGPLATARVLELGCAEGGNLLPMASGAWKEATAAADPPPEPPGIRSRSQGLRVGPKAECSVEEPIANSSMLVLPRITIPASRRRRVTVAS